VIPQPFIDDLLNRVDIVDVVGRYVQLKKGGANFMGLCPFHNEKSPSFSVSPTKQFYHCFGCGAHGDVIDFYQERYACTRAEACRELTGEKAKSAPVDRSLSHFDAYAGYEIGRPPADVPPFKAGHKTTAILNPKRIDATGKVKSVVYRPSMVFPYRNRKGGLIGYVFRVDIDDKKLTPGIWWTTNKETGFEGWSHGSFPKPRPLYGLEELDEHPDWQILLVEGEKCKDSAKRLMEGKRIIPMTRMGGGKSISKVHWKSLEGRSVVIWPDNDEEGWRTVLGWPHGEPVTWSQGIVEYLFEAGVKAVKIVMITQNSRPKGWDIADAEAEGLGQRGVELIMRERIEQWTPLRHAEWKRRQIAAAQKEKADGNGANGSDNRDDGDDAVSVDRERGAGEHHSQANGRDREAEKRTTASADVQSGSDVQQLREVGRGFGIDGETWRAHLIMKADGDGLRSNSLQNIALLLQYESRFAGIFAWNEFAKEVYLLRRPPWDMSGHGGVGWRPRKLTEPDITSAACWLEYCGMSPKTNDVGKVIVRVAQHNSYNPVVEALEALTWDGVPRISGGDDMSPWLTHYLGAADTTENRAFGRKWLVGAVARALHPGCKNDTMIVLEGPQGLKKSTALRVIADAVTPGVFTDEMSDPNSKDAGLQMQGAWIVEISELDAFRRAETTQIKAWLSRQVDRFRRPYGKIVEDFPRSCVFAGTVNPVGVGYLKDPSGGRRIWPVSCGKIDLDALRADAPQLWAEAVQAYRDGEQWWLDENEEPYAQIAQEMRYEEDPFGEMIDHYVSVRTTVTALEIMKEVLEIPPERRNSLALRRVAAHLHSRGWTRVKDGDHAYYQRPSKERLV